MKVKKTVVALLSMIILCSVIAVPVYALGSSYSSYIEMPAGTWQFDGVSRDFSNGETLKMNFRLQSSGYYTADLTEAEIKTLPSSSYLRASLYRKGFLSNTYISFRDYKNGIDTTHKWVNVGPGKYYWSFEKFCRYSRDAKYYARFYSGYVLMWIDDAE